MKRKIKKILIILILLLLVVGLAILIYKNRFGTKEIKTSYRSFEITEGGEYKFDKSFNQKAILVDTNEKVKIVLNSVSINNKKGPCIAIISKGKTTIELVGKNKLTSGTNYDNKELEGVIYSEGDLTFTGNGSLTVSTGFEDGIHSKSNININSGEFNVTAPKDGIKALETLTVEDGKITIKAGEDGIKAFGQTSEDVGNLVINKGTFKIDAESKAVRSITKLTINGGKFDLKAEEGIESTYVQINDGEINITASDDGINASIKSTFIDTILEVNGGTINIKTTMNNADAFDSNGNLYINGGNITIDAHSPFDWDVEGVYNGGTVIVNGEQVFELQNEFDGRLNNTNNRYRTQGVR